MLLLEWDGPGGGGRMCELCRALSRRGWRERADSNSCQMASFFPLKEVGTSCCDMIHKNSVSCGFARAF